MSDGRHLISELRRRNVLRAVVAYWVAAWTCIEVSSVIESALSLPEWVDLMFVIASIAGLPIVIAVSWIFEWGPTGLVTDKGDETTCQVATIRQELASLIAREVYEQLSNDSNHSIHELFDSNSSSSSKAMIS